MSWWSKRLGRRPPPEPEPDEEGEDDDAPWPPEAVEIPIDGVLDLHNFKPKEVGDVVRAYVEACLEENLLDLRIIHGKGKGVLKKRVHATLSKMDEVDHFELADITAGGWGATLVRLKPP